MFSSLRPGATLYILDKSGEPEVNIGYVETVSQPRPMYKTYNPAVTFGTNMQSVVDIAVKINGERKEIVGVPSNDAVHSYGDYTVSETREGMISEIDYMLQNSKNIIDSIDQHKKIVASCEAILKKLNPVYAKEQQRDTAIEDLTNQVNNMQTVLTRLESLFTKNVQNENNEKL